MKKFFASLGIALAATLSLTNCTKELESPVEPVSEGIPFEVSTILTKTTNDGKSTKWSPKDSINLFHSVAGKSTYTDDGKFTVDADLTGIFSGTIADDALEAGKTYDWYAFYPYSSYITTPANTSGYIYIGCRSDRTQTQTGNNSTNHLAGTALPLYGVAEKVDASATPSFEMNHLTSVICVEVSNTSGSELTVSNIAFTSTEDIVGSYYIDFTASPVKYTSSAAKYVSSTANLTVSGGEAIANNASAKFYIAIKPHTVASGSTLKLSVNGYEKTLTAPAAGVTFTAGKIKTLKFKYDYVKTVVATKDDEITLTTTGVTENSSSYKSWSGKKGSASDAVYAGKSAGGNSSIQIRLKDSDSGIISTTSGGKVKKVSVTWNSNTTTGRTLNVYGSNTAYTAVSDLYDSTKQGTLLGTIVCGTSTELEISGDYTYVGLRSNSYAMYLDKITIAWDASGVSKDPIIVAGDVTGVSARGLSAEELTFSITNPVDGTSISATCDGTVVTNVTVTDGKVAYTVGENTTGAAREGTITLTYGTVTKEVKVSQNADTFESTVTEIVLDATADSKKTFTVTSDFDWTAAFTGENFKVSPPSYTWKEGGKQTVTVTASADNTSESGTIGLGTLKINNSKTGEVLKVAIKQKSSYVAVTGKASILTLSSSNKFATTSGSTLTADDETVWTVNQTSTTGEIYNSYESSYYGQQFGSSNKPWTGTFSANFTGKTVTKIEIVANTGSSATVSATVAGAAFGEAVSVTQQSGKELTYSFTGSAAGEIVLTVSNTNKAFYLGRIIVTYE